jgi:hypothetical protein
MMNAEPREWRDVSGWIGFYQVSENGLVRSVARMAQRSDANPQPVFGKVMSTGIGSAGYPKVRLSRLGLRKMELVHRLVAEAFIPNPDGLPEVNHKNGDKTDCRVSNLEWASKSDNQLHAYRVLGIQHAPGMKGEKNGNSRLSESSVRNLRRDRLDGTSYAKLGKRYGIAPGSAYRICNGISWSHVPPPEPPDA